jgi:hypothetical protein
MRSLFALLILAAALFVGACTNTNTGGSAAPTLNPLPSTEISPATSPELSPAASPSA